MPISYDSSKINKIFSYSGDKIYFGATTKQYLSQAMSDALSRNPRVFKNSLNLPVSKAH